MELTSKPITLRSFILVGHKMYSHIVLTTCCNKIPDNSNSERKCSFQLTAQGYKSLWEGNSAVRS